MTARAMLSPDAKVNRHCSASGLWQDGSEFPFNKMGLKGDRGRAAGMLSMRFEGGKP